MREQIERFFRSYRDAYNRLDPHEVAQHIAVPSLLAQHGCTLWATKEQVRDDMARLVAFYQQNDFEAADFTLDHVMPQGADNVAVDVIWTIARNGGKAPWRFHTGYNLRRFDEGWQIILCTAYEEPLLPDRAR